MMTKNEVDRAAQEANRHEKLNQQDWTRALSILPKWRDEWGQRIYPDVTLKISECG
jgi:hypothetical protein